MAKVTNINGLVIDVSKTAEEMQQTVQNAQQQAVNVQPELSSADGMNQMSGAVSQTGLEYLSTDDPNVTGDAASADGFYTTVEQFQYAYDADIYGAVAEDMGYTANPTNGAAAIYNTAQSVLAFTGNVSNLVDSAQLHLPDSVNGIIDAIQVGVGSIRENFYELLEAQQNYGFLNGLKVWFTAKTEPEKYFQSNTSAVFDEGYNQNSAEWLYTFNADVDSLGSVDSLQDLTQDVDFIFNPTTGLASIPALSIANIIQYGDPYANIDIAMNDAIDQIDANFESTMEYNVLQIASQRQISIAEAQNVLAQIAIGENPEEGLMASTGLLELENPDDDMEERVEDTDDRYFDMGFAYDEEDGLYTKPMSCADRYYYAQLLFDPEDGILSANIEAMLEDPTYAGYSREDIISSLDSTYGLGISFDEDGNMYCKPYIELLADQYPDLQEYLEQNNYTFAGDTRDHLGSGRFQITNWMNNNPVVTMTVEQLESFGVPTEQAEWYVANANNMYASDVDMYSNNNPDYIVPNSPEALAAESALTDDMQDDSGAWNKAAQFVDSVKTSAIKQKNALLGKSQDNIPAAVEENYTTDTSAEDEYGL